MSVPEGYIRQHTLFERTTFNEMPLAKRWRSNPSMILIMPEVDEKALHREMEGLPLPSRHLAQRALSHLMRLPNELGRMQRFCSVKALLWDIADRYDSSEASHEALVFATHLETQSDFYSRVLTAEEERELNISATNHPAVTLHR